MLWRVSNFMKNIRWYLVAVVLFLATTAVGYGCGSSTSSTADIGIPSATISCGGSSCLK
jgi:hypothetical protein